MAAKNQQPTGSRPGPKSAEVHSPYAGNANTGGFVSPASSAPKSGHPGDPGNKNGVANHGTPKGVGANKSNPLH